MFVPMDNVRDSDLILAQNEFAYVLDTNNGRVNVVVGPTKETLTTTDQPMRYRGLPRKPRGLAPMMNWQNNFKNHSTNSKYDSILYM